MERQRRDKSRRSEKFATENVTVTILIPKAFDKSTLDRCNEEHRNRGPEEGAFKWHANNRDYAFRCQAARSAGKKHRLTIVDVARPLFAVETFHRHVKHFKDSKIPRLTAEEWKKTQTSERGGEFLNYFPWKLMAIERVNENWRAVRSNGQPVLFGMRDILVFVNRLESNSARCCRRKKFWRNTLSTWLKAVGKCRRMSTTESADCSNDESLFKNTLPRAFLCA